MTQGKTETRKLNGVAITVYPVSWLRTNRQTADGYRVVAKDHGRMLRKVYRSWETAWRMGEVWSKSL